MLMRVAACAYLGAKHDSASGSHLRLGIPRRSLMVAAAARLRVLAGRVIRVLRITVFVGHVRDVDPVDVFRMGATGQQGQYHGAAAQRSNDGSTLDLRRPPLIWIGRPLRGLASKRRQPDVLLSGAPTESGTITSGLSVRQAGPTRLPVGKSRDQDRCDRRAMNCRVRWGASSQGGIRSQCARM